ncbi:MAG TPA: winged helix-turn-helix domain-containing protein [Thermomicrobiales bacterium]|nr:winged helix-turn-helix domain-containing protein [Thermomicrobiales bacterium]
MAATAATLRMDGKRSMMPLTWIGNSSQTMVYGSLVLDITTEQASRDGDEVALQQSDWAILNQLAAANNTFVRGSDLLESIWGDDMRDDALFLRSWVQRLNDRLCRGSGCQIIDTLPGSYRLISPDECGTELDEFAG